MKFKPGDRVVWNPNDHTIHSGTILEWVTGNVWSVQLPSFNERNHTLCFENHLTLDKPVERKRRGFASFVHRIEGN